MRDTDLGVKRRDLLPLRSRTLPGVTARQMCSGWPACPATIRSWVERLVPALEPFMEYAGRRQLVAALFRVAAASEVPSAPTRTLADDAALPDVRVGLARGGDGAIRG